MAVVVPSSCFAGWCNWLHAGLLHQRRILLQRTHSPQARPSAENPSPRVMFYVYVLQSLSYGSLYVGNSENPEQRLENEHNRGKVRYTKGRMPWVLIYKEAYPTRSQATQREKFLKSGQGRKYLKEILSKAAGSSKGRTRRSGRRYRGSNPCPAALDGID